MKRVWSLLLFWVLALVGTAMADVSLPDGLKNVPQFPNSKVVAAISQGNGEMATLEAPGTPQQIKVFYKENLPKAGWKIEMEMEQPELSIVSCAKDQLKLVVAANKKSEGVVAFTITLSKD
jgi:hypothetical protein